MFFKFVALVAVAAVGVVVAATGLSFSGNANTEWKTRNWFENTSTNISDWAVAFYAGLWAFDGWDNTNYVTGEFKNPSRDLPRVIHTAMPLVILSYLLANISYIFVLPLNLINNSNTVAVQFGNRVFGPIGALVLAIIVGASCFGALNATSFTASRLVYVAGREGYIPSFFGNIGLPGSSSSMQRTSSLNRLQKRNWFHKTISNLCGLGLADLFYTPTNALILNFLLTCIYVALGEFRSLITFYGVAGYSFYFLTVLGLIVLRIREPHLPRPYRTWITTPICFCCVSLFLVSRAVVARPVEAAVVLAFVASGLPVYYCMVKRVRDRESGRTKEGDGRFWRRWGRGFSN